MKTIVATEQKISVKESVLQIVSKVKKAYKRNEQELTFGVALVAAMAYDTRPIVCFGLIAVGVVMCLNFTKEEEQSHE